MSSVATGNHAIQDILRDLGRLPAAGATSDDDHLVVLYRRDYRLRHGGYGEGLPLLETLGEQPLPSLIKGNVAEYA